MRRSGLSDHSSSASPFGGLAASSSTSGGVPRSRVAPAAVGRLNAGSAAASSSGRTSSTLPTASGARFSSSSASASPPSDADMESLVSWERSRSLQRAADARALRDRTLERDREMERDRREIQRLGGASRELSDMLAEVLARTSIAHSLHGDDDSAGPVLDSNGRAKTLSMTLRCFSYDVVGKSSALSMGDKIILPPEALYNVQKIRLPFPLLFRIENWSPAEQKKKSLLQSGHDSDMPLPPQYVGVLEFSAPEEHIYLPSWLMENLRMTEGGSVRIFSETGLPQGQWIKLVPHSVAFSKILRDLGPKYFLEMALRHYSVLTKGQRILITHGGENFSLNVVDCRPAATVSLLGNLDLEVEFGVALDAPKEDRDRAEAESAGQVPGDGSVTFRSRVSGGHAVPASAAAGPDDEDEELKKAIAMSLAESSHAAAASSSPSPPSPIASFSPTADDEGWAVGSASSLTPSKGIQAVMQARFGGGKRVGGGYVVPPASQQQQKAEVTTPGKAMQQDDVKSQSQPGASSQPQAAAASSAAAPAVESDDAVSSEDDEAFTGALPPNHTLCPSCSKPISNASYSLHSLHCARAFVKCAECGKRVKKGEIDEHKRRHEKVACEACGETMEMKRMKKHRKAACAYRPVACKYCAQSTPLIDLPSHETTCGNTPETCSICSQPIPRRLMPSHPNSEGCRVQCIKCDEIVQASAIGRHMQERCAGRMMACEFCKLSFAYRDFAKHQEYCGSRTEQCEECKKYVKLRDMTMHLESKCTYPTTPAPEARASPSASPRGSGGASDRLALLQSLLSSGERVDPGVMAALLASDVEREDPLAAAANRAAVASASSSIAARQAASARERVSRAQAMADALSDDADSDDEKWSRGQAARGGAKVVRQPSLPMKQPARRSPPASAARAPSIPRSQPASAAAASFSCAYCSSSLPSLEALQIHILTSCHEAHATMEAVDPQAAEKALEGKGKQVEREHVNVRIPVAKPVIGRASSGSGASASPSSSSSPPAGAFDPYDLSWKRPKRDANEELLRYAATRKSGGAAAAAGAARAKASGMSSDDSDVEELPPRVARLAAVQSSSSSSAATKPKLMTSNSKLKSAASSSTAAPPRPRASALDEYDEPITSYLSGGSSSLSSSALGRKSGRSTFTATPLSLKQQQKEVSNAIATRKAADAVLAAAKAKKNYADLDDDLDDSPVRQRPSAATSTVGSSLSSQPRVSSGSSRISGVPSSFMGGLGNDAPKASRTTSGASSSSGTSRASAGLPSAGEDYDAWLAQNFPNTAARSTGAVRPAATAGSNHLNAPSSGRASHAAPTSPLSALLTNARANASQNQVSLANSSMYTPYTSLSSSTSSAINRAADRPSSGSRSALGFSPHVPIRRPQSPPSQQKPSSSSSSYTSASIGSSSKMSSGASASAATGSSRVRVPSAGRPAAARSATTPISPHVPLYPSSLSSGITPKKPAAARKY